MGVTVLSSLLQHDRRLARDDRRYGPEHVRQVQQSQVRRDGRRLRQDQVVLLPRHAAQGKLLIFASRSSSDQMIR
jgi:hypothetical protein